MTKKVLKLLFLPKYTDKNDKIELNPRVNIYQKICDLLKTISLGHDATANEADIPNRLKEE